VSSTRFGHFSSIFRHFSKTKDIAFLQKGPDLKASTNDNSPGKENTNESNNVATEKSASSSATSTPPTTTSSNTSTTSGETKKGKDPTGWWISEKLDGVRAYWNGKKMYFKDGTEMHPPPGFVVDFPPVPLDGELWAGRQNFYEVAKAVKSTEVEAWRDVKYLVFDTTQSQMKYEERMEFINKYIPANHSNISQIDIWRCKSNDDLMYVLAQVEQNGGEGIILRKPQSYYYEQMSFFKLERYDDDDAMVVENLNDSKAMKCRLSNGKEFVLPTPTIDPLPAPESIITFRYLAMSKQDNIPTCTSLLRIRPELKWSDIHNLKLQVPYHVSFAQRSGAVKCRGCKRTITDKHELRIRVAGMFTAPNSGPHPGKNSFCLNAQCIEQAIKRDSKNNTVYYPAYDGKVLVTKEVKDAFANELPQLEGIQWIFPD